RLHDAEAPDVADFEDMLKGVVPVLPADWPGQKGNGAPGDLTTFLPQGFGLGPPMVLRPWDRMESLFERGSYYGFDAPGADPIRSAPSTDADGGVLYFDDHTEQAALDAAMSVIGVRTHLDEFATFVSTADDPQTDRYLDQMRIVSRSAIAGLFG